MKKALFLLAVVFILGCSKEDRYKDQCNAENPFEMEWFQEWISDLQNCACTVSIFQAEYEGETVFWEMMTDPICQGVIENITVRCCIGCDLKVIENYDELVDFQKKVINMKIIYQCPTPGD